MRRLAILVTAAIVACAQSQLIDRHGRDLFADAPVYTLVNLHPRGNFLSAVNYQYHGLIPMCTEVQLLDLGRKKMDFLVVETGKRFEYYYHRAAGEPFADHLRRFFGSQCDDERLRSLDNIDQQGVREGRAYPRMSRQGVIFALGYPPRHKTPDLETRTWTYWTTRFKRMQVEFDSKGFVRRAASLHQRAHSYSVEPVGAAFRAVKLPPNAPIFVGVPDDGTFAGVAQHGSGWKTARATVHALSVHSNSVRLATDVHDLDQNLEEARGGGFDYLLQIQLVKWEERATEWSGMSDQVAVHLTLLEVSSGKPLDAAMVRGSSRFLTLGGDHPEELLPEPLREYADRLFRTADE